MTKATGSTLKDAIELAKLKLKLAVQHICFGQTTIYTEAKRLDLQAQERITIHGHSPDFFYSGKVKQEAVASMSVAFATDIATAFNQTDPIKVMNARVLRGETKRLGVLVVELDDDCLRTFWASSQDVDQFLPPIHPIDPSNNVGICPRCRFTGVFPVTPEQCDQESSNTQQGSEGSNGLE